MRPDVEPEDVLIDVSEDNDLSNAAAGEGRRLVGIITPSAWDAADITFEACVTPGGTFLPVHEESSDTAVTVQAGASRYIRLKTTDWACYPYIKVKTSAAQTADRTITLLFRREH